MFHVKHSQHQYSMGFSNACHNDKFSSQLNHANIEASLSNSITTHYMD